jgi:hypothetical protein
VSGWKVERCPHCGANLLDEVPDGAIADEQGKPLGFQQQHPGPIYYKGWPDLPGSNAGRHPDVSQAARTEYLQSILEDFHDPLPAGADWLGTISEQERLVELCLADMEAATKRWRGSRQDAPELAGSRELNPQQRHDWVVSMLDQEAHEATIARYEKEHSRLLGMYDNYERAIAPIPSWAIRDPYGD